MTALIITGFLYLDESVGVAVSIVFGLYMLYETQGIRPRVKIRVTLPIFNRLMRLREQFTKKSLSEPTKILNHMWRTGCFDYHAAGVADMIPSQVLQSNPEALASVRGHVAPSLLGKKGLSNLMGVAQLESAAASYGEAKVLLPRVPPGIEKNEYESQVFAGDISSMLMVHPEAEVPSASARRKRIQRSTPPEHELHAAAKLISVAPPEKKPRPRSDRGGPGSKTYTATQEWPVLEEKEEEPSVESVKAVIEEVKEEEEDVVLLKPKPVAVDWLVEAQKQRDQELKKKVQPQPQNQRRRKKVVKKVVKKDEEEDFVKSLEAEMMGDG